MEQGFSWAGCPSCHPAISVMDGTLKY